MTQVHLNKYDNSELYAIYDYIAADCQMVNNFAVRGDFKSLIDTIKNMCESNGENDFNEIMANTVGNPNAKYLYFEDKYDGYPESRFVYFDNPAIARRILMYLIQNSADEEHILDAIDDLDLPIK